MHTKKKNSFNKINQFTPNQLVVCVLKKCARLLANLLIRHVNNFFFSATLFLLINKKKIQTIRRKEPIKKNKVE